jgi:hypothetical protein
MAFTQCLDGSSSNLPRDGQPTFSVIGKKMEADEARDLIDEAVERAEAERDSQEVAERTAERQLRERISILIGVLAVCLAIVHMAAAAAARNSLLAGIEASDTFAYMQAKVVRETIYKTAGSQSSTQVDRAAFEKEARRLRAPDAAGHGIGQLQVEGERLREQSDAATAAGEGYELGETALQMAIVLLSIALVARSKPIIFGASALAAVGILLAVLTKLDIAIPWIA